MSNFKNRIVGHDIVNLDQILFNPRNWRIHPLYQQDALKGVLDDVGYVQQVIVNQRTGNLIDGHLRCQLAAREGNETIPVVYVDLSEEEEGLILATLDPIAGMAVTDKAKLDDLFADIQSENENVQKMIKDISEREGLEDIIGNSVDVAHKTLSERFIVPPFSVLDARQGYWQKRKSAWIALGIESELGRGDNIVPNGTERPPEHDGARLRHGRASPGGSPRDAATLVDGHTVRGDGKGRGLARCFGQDLMKGENANFDNNGLLGISQQARSHYKGRPPHAANVTQNADGTRAYHPSNNGEGQSGTSIFDPVLCELVYRWFCPGGKILDPFAGGSVRGIVASILGLDYTGIDLRQEQIEANEAQAQEILSIKSDDSPVEITVSGKWARHLFSCTPEYIQETCRGRCCEGTDRILISLLPGEQDVHREHGFGVENGLLLPDPGTGKCPHKQANGLCGVHGTPLKPFGCIASPFTINNNNTLIIRNRYSLMNCHGSGEPAYKVFSASLKIIFGDQEADRICKELDKGSNDVVAKMPRKSYDALKYLDGLKHGSIENKTKNNKYPKWVKGDSLNVKDIAADEYDLIFSCPPYYDLELYSDDQNDLSNYSSYELFIEVYKQIISDCVEMLKQDRFACFVVGDIRDKKGLYRNFPADTIDSFQSAGMRLYNEAVLVTAVGSLPIRVGRQFQGYRKLGKTHQNVLVFYKGDPANIKQYGDVEAGDIDILDGGSHG